MNDKLKHNCSVTLFGLKKFNHVFQQKRRKWMRSVFLLAQETNSLICCWIFTCKELWENDTMTKCNKNRESPYCKERDLLSFGKLFFRWAPQSEDNKRASYEVCVCNLDTFLSTVKTKEWEYENMRIWERERVRERDGMFDNVW